MTDLMAGNLTLSNTFIHKEIRPRGESLRIDATSDMYGIKVK